LLRGGFVEEDGRPSAGGERGTPPLEPAAWDQIVAPSPPIFGESLAATIATLADPASRSPIPATCPFLRTINSAGEAQPPIDAPFHTNRCVALDEPVPQSAKQQQLVCLTAAHSNCPRYLRGSQVATDALAPAEKRGASTPVVVSALLLVAATAMSVGFLLVRGGFDLPAAAAPGRSQVAVAASPSPAASPIATPQQSEPPTATAVPSALPTPSPVQPTAAPTAIVTAPPTSAPTPLPAPTPAATSDRYVLLTPCLDVDSCWIYTVRSGDNLRSIANYFGVPYDTVLRMNPQITSPASIRAGDEIRMPPPTR
jgi:LysM domain-containing protein